MVTLCLPNLLADGGRFTGYLDRIAAGSASPIAIKDWRLPHAASQAISEWN